MIENYSFAKIVVNGVTYTNDINNDIELIEEKISRATTTVNRLRQQEKEVGAGFYRSC